MTRRGFLSLALAGAVCGFGAAALTARVFEADMARARARIAGRSALVRTATGLVEVAEAGDGPPVLAIHGTGGGFDQGLAMLGPLANRGFRLIAPSRFGYLRSPLPADASADAQADAFAALLDALGVARAAVVGGSAGALSAVAFAIRHPDRCAALVPLVPAAWAPDRSAEPPSPLAMAAMQRAMRSDFAFWLTLKTAPRQATETLLATDWSVVAAATPAEQARVRQILWDILPVSDRADGLLNDMRQALNLQPMALETISAPTLAISLEDDRFDTYLAARHIAASVPGARLLSFETGGHVWVGHQEALFDGMAAFLRESAALRS